ncbi:Eco29kI family restriction endonuclease [uncultured Parolsenella sp.]|uniref:Eco29kI family restriction endonuclease n=1 Tax=uncultured Parolsenella sp. TaxID=2083008 RepID=UPI0025D858AB|nr:Eco29kI family restriction endonuclease [uncultured Parolsenella sp.]
MKPCSYNPLDYASLSESLARELMSSELMPLSDIEKFYGDGVYALFYCGDFPAYQELSDINFSDPGTFPIYIGKAGPKTLTGNELDTSAVDTPRAGMRLYDRVANDHRKSIEAATNLRVEEFYCRMLVLNAVWVPLTESALIARYVPVWNSIVPGFGNHAPGKGRVAGKISRWDILHPGRGRETATAPTDTYEQLCEEVEEAIRKRVRLLGL